MKQEEVYKNKKAEPQNSFDQFYDLQSVVSAQGMTGLIPDLPQSKEEGAAYSDLHGLPKQP